MIYLYSGTPGSGKSLHIARGIYLWTKYGNSCVANFPVNLDGIKSKNLGEVLVVDNEHLTPELLIVYSKLYFKTHKFKEGALRVYIDECQLIFNAREWNIKGRKEWLSFFTQHRKYGYDIFLVAQFDRMIDRQIRSLIEYEYIHRKVANFGKLGKIINLFSAGTLFICVEVWYPMSEVVNREFYKGNKRYFELYNTYNLFGS